MSEQPQNITQSIKIRPIVNYPREAQPGQTYLMTIDVQLASPDTPWPYPDEEYPITFILNTQPYFRYEPLAEGGEPGIVLHRFGGTYGPAHYLLTAAEQQIKPGHISITFMNRWGLPITHMELPCEIKRATRSGQVRKIKQPAHRRTTPTSATPEPLTLSGHYNIVWSCAISPDGRFIVSASVDHTLKVWDASTGMALFTLSGHHDAVEGCAISPDGRFIVSASADHTLKVWDISTGTELSTLFGHTDTVWSCTISPDGRFVVSASADRTLKVWDFASGKELFTLSGHTNSVYSCAISPDGRFIVSASWDNTLKVWDASTGAEFFTLSGHASSVWRCAVSPDGRFIVSASADRTLKVWDFASGKELFTLSGHTDKVYGCAVSPDGRFIVSASADHTLKVWETSSGAERFTLSGHSNAVYGCAVSPDGRFIVSASWDSTLKVWDVAERVRDFAPIQPTVLPLIERKLIQAGWVVQDTTAINIGVAQGIAIREFPLVPGRVDYLLVIDGKAVGVIENKEGTAFPRSAQSIEDQLWQYQTAQPAISSSIRFQRQPLPFAYGVTGLEIQFTNHLEPDARSRIIFHFHRPETLALWLNQAPIGTPNEMNNLLRSRLRRMPPMEEAGLYNQEALQAVAELEKSLAANRPRALIQMPDGSGKTPTLVYMAYRLLRFANARRILLLVNSDDYTQVAYNDFSSIKASTLSEWNMPNFTELFNVQILRDTFIDPDAHIYISTIEQFYRAFSRVGEDRRSQQQFFSEQENALQSKAKGTVGIQYNPSIPIEFFDVILINNCRAEAYRDYRPLLEYFDAFVIGAVSKLDDRVRGFFDNNVVYEYEVQRPRALILTTIPAEHYAVRTYLTDLKEERFNEEIYQRGAFLVEENQAWDILLAQSRQDGSDAALPLARAINSFNPQLMISVGLASGVENAKVGDVIVATKVYQYVFGRSGAGFSEVFTPASRIEQQARRIARDGSWLKHLKNQKPDVPPNILFAPVTSGERLTDSRRTYELLRSAHSDALAIEMEGAGFLAVSRHNPSIETLVVRGISDQVNREKRDNGQEIAVQHTSAFVFGLLAELSEKKPGDTDTAEEEYQGLVALPYDEFERFLRDQENKYWAVDKRSIEEFISGRPASVEELLHAIEMNGDGTQCVYLFRSDISPEEVIRATNWEAIPEITREDINDEYIISSKGNDLLAFDCNTDEASNCEPAILLPYENDADEAYDLESFPGEDEDEDDEDGLENSSDEVEAIHQRFSTWLANQQRTRTNPFTSEQIRWLERMRDRIASAGQFREKDFERTPFSFEGGLLAARSLFASELPELIRTLNDTLTN